MNLNSNSTSNEQQYFCLNSQQMQHVDPHGKLQGVTALSEQFPEILPCVGNNGRFLML